MTRTVRSQAARTAAAAALALMLFGSGTALAADPPLEAAVRLLERASDGDESAVAPALKEFTRLSAAAPGDPLLMSYLGAATALQAETTYLPWRKLSYAEDGLAMIDKALALLTPAHDAPRADGTPTSLETRFVAASTFLSLPGFFNRRVRGEQLLKRVMDSPQLATSSLTMRGSVWMQAGVQAIEDKRPADARRWFQQVITANAEQAPSARAKLKELGP